MKESACFRHELKYPISYAKYLAIRQRLRPIMHLDNHARKDGCYWIRSIYFDNTDDKALKEKMHGVAKREKFRIRYYNDNLSNITLEKKMKINNLCQKVGAPLTEAECRKLLNGDTSWMISHKEPLVQELYFKMKSQGLKPKVLVSYVREPYVYKAGNVRVTFDSQIRTSIYSKEFLENINDISALDDTQQIILEIKYDNFLPEIISHIIQTDGIRQQAFSKYGACRRFG